MPATRKNIGDTVRGITRKALTQGKLDRAAVRRASGEAIQQVREDLAQARKSIGEIERLVLKALGEAAAAGKGAASQSMNATLASGAIVARVASGMLAGIADSLSGGPPRSRRRRR
jgi:hypothetical protein